MIERREKLEQLVDGLARAQPVRRAPISLQARVMTQIASRQVRLPWWHKGFAHWPLAARATFLLASLGFARLALLGVMAVVDVVQSFLSEPVSIGFAVLHAIPPLWLYAGAAIAFGLYAVLFGLGTFAYRTLYVQR
jgi:hypothetical protein